MDFILLRIVVYVTTIVMHTSNVVVMLSGFTEDVMKNDIVRQYKELQIFFFTCWTFVFQTIYAMIGLYCDLLTLRNSKFNDYQLPKVLQNVREILFAALVWPSTFLVFIVFWPMFIYDRNLFYPEDIDQAISLASNHVMHSMIVVVALLEIWLRPRTLPGSHKGNLQLLLGGELLYILIILRVNKVTGKWVYPIFGLLHGIYFYVFFGFVAVAFVIIYYSQWTLNDVLWSSKKREIKTQ